MTKFTHFTPEQSDRVNAAADDLVRMVAEICVCENPAALAQNVVAQTLVAMSRHGGMMSSDGMRAAISGALMATPEPSQMKAMQAGAEFLTMSVLGIILKESRA